MSYSYKDGVGESYVPRGSAGCVEVCIQDQFTKAFDVFFSQTVGGLLSLAVDAVYDAYTVTMAPGHGMVAGDDFVMYGTVNDRLYFGTVLSVATDVITLDTPINANYPVATAVVTRSTRDMNVNGAVTRQIFEISPPINKRIDVTRIMFQMTTTDFPELDMFGDIAGGLTRGLVLRHVNGDTVNLFNVKSNGELINLMYDVNFYEAAKQGVNGIGGRLTYGGQTKHGVTLRLRQDDALQVIVQDNLSSLLQLRMIASGHLVED